MTLKEKARWRRLLLRAVTEGAVLGLGIALLFFSVEEFLVEEYTKAAGFLFLGLALILVGFCGLKDLCQRRKQ